MRILLIGLHRFTKPYGLCRYTANLFFCLKGIDSLSVTLVLGEWQKDYYRDALQVNVDDPGILWVPLKRPGLSRYFWSLWGLPKLARRLNASLVHVVHPIPLIPFLVRRPVVMTMHDLYAYDEPASIGFPNIVLNRLVLRNCMKASDAIVSISYFTRDRLLHWFPKLEKSKLLPVIYQQVTVAAPTGKVQDFPLPKKFLLAVAQHRKNKNLDLAIEAFFLALNSGILEPDTQVVIVGSEGSETQHLKSLAAQRPGVIFLSSISDEYLFSLYRASSALLCASSIEGFCLPVVEALLLSCRVICANIPVLREVAGDQATYFELEPRSPQALVDAIALSLASDRHKSGTSRMLGSNPSREWHDLYQAVLKRHAS